MDSGRIALGLLVALLLSFPYPAKSENYEDDGAAKHQTDASARPHATKETLIGPAANVIQQTAHYCAERPDNEPEKWLKKFLCDIKLTDVLVAVFSGLLIIVTLGLIVVGWIQAGLMRRTSRNQLRAYVVVKEAVILPVWSQPDARLTAVSGHVVFLNAGQTPAYELAHSRGLTRDKWATQRDFDQPPAYNISAVVLGPGVEHADELDWTMPIGEEIHRQLLAGELSVYFWGEITYRDVFKKKRSTKFGVRWPPTPNEMGRRTIPCSPDWNNAT